MGAPEVRKPGGSGLADADSKTDTAIISDTDADAHLYALALRAGCHLFRLADGEYLLSRFGLSKAAPDARSVRALLNQIGGAA